MKSTGIVRKTDELGRIVIPKELRRTLGIDEGVPMEIFTEDDKIVLKKYNPIGECIVTGEIESTNFKIANGKITLSRKGAEQILKELEAIVVNS